MRLNGLIFGVALFQISLMAAGELSGRRAPGFSLPDVNLKQHDLADYRGRIVLLDVMKTECPRCVTFSQVLEEVQGKYGGKVVVLSIVNPPDTLDTVRQYMRKNFVTQPILFDCGQVAASYFKVTPQNPSIHIPHLFVIDGQGMIRDDFAYEGNQAIFEGKALFAVLDRMLAPAKK